MAFVRPWFRYRQYCQNHQAFWRLFVPKESLAHRILLLITALELGPNPFATSVIFEI